MTEQVQVMIAFVLVAGALGGFVNVFIGDAGLHLPRSDNGTFQPGYLGTVFVGAMAALGSFCAAKAVALLGDTHVATAFTTADLANALMVGFGGAKWFKSEGEKDILQKTAAIAAGKPADPDAAATIATGTPMQALAAARAMKQ
jgi:hypothetical protein